MLGFDIDIVDSCSGVYLVLLEMDSWGKVMEMIVRKDLK